MPSQLRRYGFDADRIFLDVHQGSRPDRPSVGPVTPLPQHAYKLLHDIGVDIVVLTARDVPPPPEVVTNGTSPAPLIIRIELDDDPVSGLDARSFRLAAEAADAVCLAAIRKKRILVTCRLGLNRSGIVVALAMVRMGVDPSAAIDTVQRRRPGALSNRAFRRQILSLEPKRRATQRG